MDLSKNMQSNFIENDFCKQWLDDEMLYCIFRPYLEIDINVVKKCVTDRKILTAGISYKMFADVKNLRYFTSEAKEYFASSEGSAGLEAIAFLVNTQIEKFIIRLFIEVNRPPIPCKIFSGKEEALEWLSFNRAKNKQ